MADEIVDTCIHQWTVDLSKMKEMVPAKWRERLAIKAKIQDPVSGSLLPSLPWHHAYWNEDAPDTEGVESGGYTNSEQYRSPELMEEYLIEEGIDTGILLGHQLKFINAHPNPEYAAALARAYNELLKEEWLSHSRMKGAILVVPNAPEAAVEEIRRYSGDPDMVSVLLYGGSLLPLGHPSVHPIYATAAEEGLPVMIHTSGNPTHRQMAGGRPQQYVTFDAALAQNHMVNFFSLVFQQVFDTFPDLDVVWAGEGVSWTFHPAWRATRYYRNLRSVSPDLEKEPVEYMNECYVTTYPLESFSGEEASRLFEMAGFENVLWGSGYPHWDADTVDDLPPLPGEARERILQENARAVFDL